MIIWSIARTTIGDALRKKILQIFLVVTIGLIVISLSFSQTLSFSTREGASADLMMLKSFGLGLMAVAGMFMSLIMGVSLIPQEIERRTIYTILSKPVNRYEFIIGKFLGAIITLAINIGLMSIVFLVTVILKAKGVSVDTAANLHEIKSTGPQAVDLFDPNMFWGVVMIYLQFMVLSSVVLFFSVFLTPMVNFFMGVGVYIIGIMAPVTQTIANAKDASAALKGFYKVVHTIIPNFDSFNVTNQLLHPVSQVTNMGIYTGKIALYAVLYALVMMVLSVILFQKREV